MKLRMFKAEKMALLILAIAVAVWCVISLCTRGVNTLPPPARIHSADSIAPIETCDTAGNTQNKESKKKKKSSSKSKTRRKSAKKQTPAPPQRDHLREPVETE